MDNHQKRQIRTGLLGLGFFMFIFSVLAYTQFQIPGLSGSILYNGYYFLLMGVVIIVLRMQIKERKMIFNTLSFFERSGLTTSYDITFEDVGPTHITYKSVDGERRKVKHFHPFVLPGSEGFDNVYLAPMGGVESNNPARLFAKYGQQITAELKTKILTAWNVHVAPLFPEMEALDPNRLAVEETETDDPDRMNQELSTVVSDIRKGFLDRMGLKQTWFQILAGIMIGALVVTMVFMFAGVDFRGVLQH